jgi:exonuclease V gamma subunit
LEKSLINVESVSDLPAALFFKYADYFRTIKISQEKKMAIQLYFSNRLEQLAEKLAESVYSERRNADIFRQPLVIVPNANLIKWLQLFFAKTRSVAMNIAFCYLEDGMRKLIQALDPAQEKPEITDKKLSRIILLYILQHSESDMPSLFHQYLGKDRADYAGRVWQLSDRLATLFQEYEFNRPEMIRGWLAGKAGLGSEMEICQQKLYLRLDEMTERLSRQTGKSFFSLRTYRERLCAKIKAGSAALGCGTPRNPGIAAPQCGIPGSAAPQCGKAVHLFSFSQLSVFYLNLIQMLGAYYEISVYALNPCQELW